MGKENIKSLIIIALIVTFSLSSTYAYMQLEASNNTATGEGGCFEVDYVKGQDINSSSLKSTTNYLEGASTEVTLSKAEDCEIYTTAEIKINTNTTTDTEVLTGALKYKVVNKSTSATVGEGTITTTSATQLASVNLTTTATVYTIYLWIDPEISQGTYNGKTYSGYIYAESRQQSTINE